MSASTKKRKEQADEDVSVKQVTAFDKLECNELTIQNSWNINGVLTPTQGLVIPYGATLGYKDSAGINNWRWSQDSSNGLVLSRYDPSTGVLQDTPIKIFTDGGAVFYNNIFTNGYCIASRDNGTGTSTPGAFICRAGTNASTANGGQLHFMFQDYAGGNNYNYWTMGLANSTSSTQTGANWRLSRWTNTGGYIDDAVVITRQNANMSVVGGIQCSANAANSGNFVCGNGTADATYRYHYLLADAANNNAAYWGIGMTVAATGGPTGSTGGLFVINSFDNSGTFTANPFYIVRGTGETHIGALAVDTQTTSLGDAVTSNITAFNAATVTQGTTTITGGNLTYTYTNIGKVVRVSILFSYTGASSIDGATNLTIALPVAARAAPSGNGTYFMCTSARQPTAAAYVASSASVVAVRLLSAAGTATTAYTCNAGGDTLMISGAYYSV